MLKAAIHWMQIIGTVADGLLLCRVLVLKLHRIYAYITLYCALQLLFDAAAWWAGWESQETTRMYFYSRFIYAALFPAIAWDVFEEIKSQIGRARRLPAARLISGLFVTAIFGCILLATVQVKDSSSSAGPTEIIGVFLWAGSCSASLVFAWSLYRTTHTEKIQLPNNTSVWFIFFILTLIRAILECGLILFGFELGATVSDVIILAFLCFDLTLAAWCILRLKAAPSHGAAASENVGS